ncbi:DUF5658 family protein [Mesobacillus subterraneus]|uniref:DUF5658 family protein n=1 Tax=Mesobacillus subterraneus TaxID=285983 RepID=UPI0026BA7B84
MTFLFYYLLILNLLDAALTYYGLENTFIVELNQLMHAIYDIILYCSSSQNLLFPYSLYYYY